MMWNLIVQHFKLSSGFRKRLYRANLHFPKTITIDYILVREDLSINDS